MPDLTGAKLKIKRAKKHFKELETEINNFFANEPFKIVKQEARNGDLLYRVIISDQIPVEWSSIIGDIIHNLRSALDYLAWQLVLQNGGTPGKNTYFPIGSSPKKYNNTVRGSLKGASKDAMELVKSLQPYPGGNDLLVQIHALDIHDKHRLNLIVGSAHRHILFTPKLEADWIPEDFPFPEIALNPKERQFPLVNGAHIFTVKKEARDLPSKFEFVFELAFGDVDEVKGRPLGETLGKMIEHVDGVVNKFDHRFFSNTKRP